MTWSAAGVTLITPVPCGRSSERAYVPSATCSTPSTAREGEEVEQARAVERRADRESNS